jgi:hypothetical protein
MLNRVTYPNYDDSCIFTRMRLTEGQLRVIIREECIKSADSAGMSPSLTEGMKWHLSEGVPFDRPVYRVGTEKYFSLIREARRLYFEDMYNPTSDFERDLLESDLGEFDIYEGVEVPLDLPMKDEQIAEAKYKGKEVELGKPKKGGGGKSYVYVRDPKTGNVKKVSFGSSMPDAMGDSEAARKRRKSFGDRHDCSNKKDRTKAGYWSCRATKFFGRNIPGWW